MPTHRWKCSQRRPARRQARRPARRQARRGVQQEQKHESDFSVDQTNWTVWGKAAAFIQSLCFILFVFYEFDLFIHHECIFILISVQS